MMHTRRQHGFTLAESVVSLLLVSGLLLAALNTVTSTQKTRASNMQQAQGQLLADALMSEILSCDYEEPVTTPTFGIEGGEGSSDRSTWDDVDDYHNWTASPPEDRAGNALTGLDGWSRQVQIMRVNSNDLTTAVAGETGIKVIKVTVQLNGRTISTAHAVRTNAWQEVGR